MEYTFRGDLRTDVYGFRKLLEVYNLIARPGQKKIRPKLNFEMNFFDANMSAILLAMIQKVEDDNGTSVDINLTQIDEKCEVLRRNGFASYIEGSDRPLDPRRSTVPLMTFRSTDVDSFVSYIENDFLKHRGLEGKLSKGMERKRKDSYNEPLYTCGQFFPKKNHFKFTMVDVGVGFLENIERKDPSITTYGRAIDWALKGGNSTKKGKTRGGTGLSTILAYCREFKGQFHIISGDCYWVFTGTEIEKFKLNQYFCGTTVHLIFRY
jgi:hypothetical protein